MFLEITLCQGSDTSKVKGHCSRAIIFTVYKCFAMIFLLRGPSILNTEQALTSPWKMELKSVET